MAKKFCYWTVASGKHGEMARGLVKSARSVGVSADFHIFTDLQNIEGAIVHPCGVFSVDKYMFKFHFLKNEITKLDYDYFVFLDADNYFVRDPGDLSELLGDDKVFIQMENDCSPYRSKRQDWWSCPINEYGPFLRENGAIQDTYYNTNAGFWIIRKDAIDEVYKLGITFFNNAHKKGYSGFTEEPSLAYIGHMLQDPSIRTFENTNWLWATDWTGQYKDKLPDGNEWLFEDYMSGDKISVNPCIVHCMRSKDKLIEYGNTPQVTPQVASPVNQPINNYGFWMGHKMLGDVIGFCAAAHLYYTKTKVPVKVNFDENRKDAALYFEGVEWVPKSEIPNAKDCGGTPSPKEWQNLNGVKRFYKYMDPTLECPKSFDIHMMVHKRKSNKKLIGLITHANTQGDIPEYIVNEMISEAKSKYPEHKIVLFGGNDNKIVPEGVIDMRQPKADINWIINFMQDLDLLIAPQTGPCFIAAGLKIPMWIYRSKELHWDYVLNYDNHKVEKWWERNAGLSNYLKGNYRKKFVSKFEKFEKIFENNPLAESVYIVGSSASIKEMPNIYNFLENKVTCLLNATALDKNFKGEYFFLHHTNDYEKYGNYYNCGSDSDHFNSILASDKFKFMPGYNNIIDSGVFLGDNTFTFADHSKNDRLLHHTKNVSRNSGTIASDAMEVMAQIGYKKVYLIGVDLKKISGHNYYNDKLKDKFHTKPDNNKYMNSIVHKYPNTEFITLSPWGAIDNVDLKVEKYIRIDK